MTYISTPESDKFFSDFSKGKNIYLTGNAGSGKSFLINKMQKDYPEKTILKIAPTGIAAINIGGQTIHRFLSMSIGTHSIDSSFDIKLFTDIRKRYSSKPDEYKLILDKFVVIIDEVSMVRADLMDIFNNSLKSSTGLGDPFGGVQVILVGDPYQLPPIEDDGWKQFLKHHYKSPYFFDSYARREGVFSNISLKKIFRQSDKNFINLLNNIRVGTRLDSCLTILNKRVTRSKVPGSVILCSTNKKVDLYNKSEFRNIEGEEFLFMAVRIGKFPNDMIPVPHELVLKVGAQVMIKVNAKDLSYVNGTIGIFQGVTEDEKLIITSGGDEFLIEKNTRKITKPEMDGDSISNNDVGKYIQYPVVLSRAITINKSQGLTFDQVYVDTDRGLFAAGQGYVALSRCTSFDGIRLAKPFRLSDIKVSQAVVALHQ